MSAPAKNPYPSLWKARAKVLDRQGYFREYDKRFYEEVISKGYLGRHDPEEALQIAKTAVEDGTARYHPKFVDELRDHFNLALFERRAFVLQRLAEIQPDSYEPPHQLEEPPGYPYIFHSRELRIDLYLKFQLHREVRRPHVLFWSCHPPVVPRRRK
jgi:hypothetical protein